MAADRIIQVYVRGFRLANVSFNFIPVLRRGSPKSPRSSPRLAVITAQSGPLSIRGMMQRYDGVRFGMASVEAESATFQASRRFTM
jgi:uncharacterized Zn-binding protein involved in type VI secretion